MGKRPKCTSKTVKLLKDKRRKSRWLLLWWWFFRYNTDMSHEWKNWKIESHLILIKNICSAKYTVKKLRRQTALFFPFFCPSTWNFLLTCFPFPFHFCCMQTAIISMPNGFLFIGIVIFIIRISTWFLIDSSSIWSKLSIFYFLKPISHSYLKSCQLVSISILFS